MAARVENHFCGMLVINKDQNYTSSDAVARLRGIVHMRRIGHTGTLDPMAEGVLPVCLGNATKVAELIADRDKEYVARLRLGIVTNTQDMTGKILSQIPEEELLRRLCRSRAANGQEAEQGGDLTREEADAQVRRRILAVAERFTGRIRQIPPMYSAVWSNGKRLYELAREGQTVERKPREIFIRELEVQSIALPYVMLRVVCSKGTYIRTLCEDIGTELGVGGAMDHLLRTRVGDFSLDRAVRLSELEESIRRNGFSAVEERLIPVDSFFAEAPALHVLERDMKYLRNGNALSGDNTAEGILPHEERIRIYDEKGTFYALYHYEEERRRILPTKMFHDTDSRGNDRYPCRS